MFLIILIKKVIENGFNCTGKAQVLTPIFIRYRVHDQTTNKEQALFDCTRIKGAQITEDR